MDYIPAKTIISKSRSPESWFGHDYNMNIYKGCSHGCIYCDSRSECYGVENFDEVRAKADALAIIENEMKSKRTKGVIATGAMSDPYNPCEKELCLTRRALELADAHGFGVAIATKSDLITRDIDVLKSINEHSPVCIKLTVTTFEEDLCRIIEPNVASTQYRLQALGKIAYNGLLCGVLLMPVLPYINDSLENISNIIRAAAESGVNFVYPALGVTLRQNQRAYYYQKLERHFPGLKQKYIDTYGESYECRIPDSKRKYKQVSELCDKYGLLYKMPEIITAYKSQRKYEQLSFFT